MSRILWARAYAESAQKQKTLATLCRQVHEAAGYTPYDPFTDAGNAPPVGQTFSRCFLPPPEKGWLILIGLPAPEVLPALAEALNTPLLWAELRPETFSIQVLGGDINAFLRPEVSLASYQAAYDAPLPPAKAQGGILGDLARQSGLESQSALPFIEKTAKSFFAKLGGGAAFQAALGQVQGATRLSWSAPAAQALHACLSLLRLPTGWQSPTYEEVADAYRAACLLEKDENAHLLPSDEAALARVDYPLDYTPLFFAR